MIIFPFLRRVAPAPSRIGWVKPESKNQPSLQIANGQSSGSNALNNPSQVHHRRNTRVSMDLSSRGTLSFENISYTIDERRTNALWKKFRQFFIPPIPEKQIVDNVSGVFESGMNAIMGKKSFF